MPLVCWPIRCHKLLFHPLPCRTASLCSTPFQHNMTQAPENGLTPSSQDEKTVSNTSPSRCDCLELVPYRPTFKLARLLQCYSVPPSTAHTWEGPDEDKQQGVTVNILKGWDIDEASTMLLTYLGVITLPATISPLAQSPTLLRWTQTAVGWLCWAGKMNHRNRAPLSYSTMPGGNTQVLHQLGNSQRNLQQTAANP